MSESVSLAQDPTDWQRQFTQWSLHAGTKWVVAGVKPSTQSQFVSWIRSTGSLPTELSTFEQIPLRVALEAPQQVGIDRLLTALAAFRLAGSRSVIAINMGTAITVDFVDCEGTFQGGTILPGPHLMALALHEQTAKLPLIDIAQIQSVVFPARSTRDAIAAGIFAGVHGALRYLIEKYTSQIDSSPVVFLTGGAARLFGDFLDDWDIAREIELNSVPQLTLEGIRIAAEESS